MRTLLLLLLLMLTVSCRYERPENTAANKNTYKWTGTINGATPVFMYYRMYDTVLSGEIVYRDRPNNDPVRIIGQKLGYHYVIEEFDKDSLVTAVWDGRINDANFTWGGDIGKEFRGRVLDVKTSRDYMFDLKKKDTDLEKNIVLDPDGILAPGAIDGTYQYNFGHIGGKSKFCVRKTDNGRVLFNSKSFASGACKGDSTVFYDDTLQIKENRAEYKGTESGCAFGITFYNTFAIISVSEMSCKFGSTSTLEGIYVKTSAAFNCLKEPKLSFNRRLQ